MKKEIWKDIEGYEGLYQVSNLGRIKSLYNYRGIGNILKQKVKRNYYEIGLRKNGIRKFYRVHRLVAEAFIPNPNNYPVINHKDENKLNNNVDNLEWCSYKYNNCYGSRIDKVKEKTSKKITQYDLEWNKIKTYKSLEEASKKTKINKGNISSCALNKKNYNHAGGYKWKYE